MTDFASKPMAFLSDVHGHLPALEAVLDAVNAQGITDIFVAGDMLLGGNEPLAVWRRLQSVGARCVRGLSDTALALFDLDQAPPGVTPEKEARLKRFESTRLEIGQLALERLRRLPDRLRIPLQDGREIVMVHGSPADPTIEMSHDLSDDELLALVGDDPADIVICGSTHVPFRKDVEQISIINVGSVGASLEPNTAHYCIVTPRLSGAQIQQLWVRF